jgi:hypothetical protein
MPGMKKKTTPSSSKVKIKASGSASYPKQLTNTRSISQSPKIVEVKPKPKASPTPKPKATTTPKPKATLGPLPKNPTLNDYLARGLKPPKAPGQKKLPSDADVIIKGYNDPATIKKYQKK